MTKTHPSRTAGGTIAAPVLIAALAAAACEARPTPPPATESTTQAATPAAAVQANTEPKKDPEPPPLTEAERKEHAAYAKEAGEELKKLQNDDNQWVMPGKNYAGTRYSTLNEITTANVQNMKVAWSMSTGTTKGHE